VVPVGGLPIIINFPASQTTPLGGQPFPFTVLAVNATGYQWMAGAPG